MALEGYEWLTVLGILLIVFLWNPNKLPEIARSIGQAKKEFEKATKEISSPAVTTTLNAQPVTDPLIVAARSLGISTQGKTKEEITKEITEKASAKNTHN